MLAGRETQCQVDNNGENDQADDANGQALCVDGDRCKRSGGEGDDSNNDSCPWLGMSATCRQHVAPTVKRQHFWLTSPCRGNTKPILTQYLRVGDY